MDIQGLTLQRTDTDVEVLGSDQVPLLRRIAFVGFRLGYLGSRVHGFGFAFHWTSGV